MEYLVTQIKYRLFRLLQFDTHFIFSKQGADVGHENIHVNECDAYHLIGRPVYEHP